MGNTSRRERLLVGDFRVVMTSARFGSGQTSEDVPRQEVGPASPHTIVDRLSPPGAAAMPRSTSFRIRPRTSFATGRNPRTPAVAATEVILSCWRARALRRVAHDSRRANATSSSVRWRDLAAAIISRRHSAVARCSAATAGAADDRDAATTPSRARDDHPRAARVDADPDGHLARRVFSPTHRRADRRQPYWLADALPKSRRPPSRCAHATATATCSHQAVLGPPWLVLQQPSPTADRIRALLGGGVRIPPSGV